VSEPSLHQQAVLWGQAYEILAKRGAIDYLVERGMIDIESPWLQAWRTHTLPNVSAAIIAALGITDPDAPDRVTAAVEHMALTALGAGHTLMRHYLDAIRSTVKPFIAGKLTVKALWCPLNMPATSSATPYEARREKLIKDFAATFGLRGTPDPQWADKGKPANADFILWLEYDGKQTFLLVQEYSYDSPGELVDFRGPEKHLEELKRFRRIVEARSVFARVTAEVEHEQFELADDMWHYLLAYVGKDKPLYKLCQASSYATSMAELLQSRADVTGVIKACALAITPNGIDSLSAHIGGANKDPRHKLMQQMATAYQKAEKVPDDDREALTRLAAKVFNGTVAKLPKPLRAQMKNLRAQMPKPGENYEFSFTEQMTDFYNPDDTFSLEEAAELIPSFPELNDYFGGDAKSLISQELSARLLRQGKLTLRDIHAAAIVAGLKRAQPGKLNLIALEGNPGIGKTTAVREYLSSQASGYLFLYLSPRVVINRDVASLLARPNGQPSGILTLTTNAQLIDTAANWYKKLVDEGKASPKRIEGAVVADGVPHLVTPNGSILVITPEQEREVEDNHTASKFRKKAISEYEDHVQDRKRPGVLRTLSSSARELIALNPGVNRLALTVALQGFKERADCKTTVSSLSELFANRSDTITGVEERRDFARKIPTIVVMVDELAGDGAGAPFVHAIAQWLRQEFLDPFEDEPSPFTVILVAADASLGNEVVFDRYLNAGERAPDKVLVSRSRGKRPFDLAVNKIALGGQKVTALSVMTNSFPASQLTLRYSVRLTTIQPELIKKGSHAGEMQTPRMAILEHTRKALRDSACTEIKKALEAQASQIIYFAQNKRALREIRDDLIAGKSSQGNQGNWGSQGTQGAQRNKTLSEDEVQILDSSVPGYERKRLVSPDVRDKVRVFLMTSSGARGVSFPRADWIIASFPRFNIEAQLMEIAQLIYRGRGKRTDEFGNEINGDAMPRTLVFTIDDFIVSEGAVDERQWLMYSLNLMTLLVMLRSTVFTRITGDAGLMQPLALVPVGAAGTEEVVSTMSQHVSAFLREANVFINGRRTGSNGLVKKAVDNVNKIFGRTELEGFANRERNTLSYISADVADRIQRVAKSMGPLIQRRTDNRPLLPPHTSFFGPVVIESWAEFKKREMFAFEEHNSEIMRASQKLKDELHQIKQTRSLPASLRNPAEALLQILHREEHDEANEFKTVKDLKSLNTWVAVPAGYQIWHQKKQSGKRLSIREAEEWHDELAATLGSWNAMPAVPVYRLFPWVAAVGNINPTNLDLVFDDRYFMASNELNLLNTLLLSRAQSSED
jgi:hypothetical protein